MAAAVGRGKKGLGALVKVALVSKSDAGGGGASRVADELFFGLNRRGGFSAERYLAHGPASALPAGYGPIVAHNRRLYSALRTIVRILGYVDHFPLELFGLNAGMLRADVIHCHDLSSAFAPINLFMLGRVRPLVWTIHDFSPLSGGCLYPLGCERYRQDCGDCPLLGTWPLVTRYDRTRTMAKWRRRVLAHSGVHLVAPSQWMKDQILARHPGAAVEVIYNGVDLNRFRPRPSSEFAQRLDKREENLNILFVANHFQEIRKGGLYLPEIVEWLRRNGKQMTMIVVGNASDQGTVDMGPLDIVFAGHVDDPDRLADIYAAADAVLNLSHADNCPLVILEALAAGVPCYAFAVGGIPELVAENCGKLRPPGRIDLLLADLFADADSGRLPILGKTARERAESHYSQEGFIENHVQLYSHIARSKVKPL
jgi:glycosyltransferase involved in cell wall biosynthesis